MGDLGNMPTAAAYEARLDKERRAFADRTVIQDLPPMHLDWVHRHILPSLSNLGYSGVAHIRMSKRFYDMVVVSLIS